MLDQFIDLLICGFAVVSSDINIDAVRNGCRSEFISQFDDFFRSGDGVPAFFLGDTEGDRWNQLARVPVAG
jgi:hypothetical protein